MATRLPATVLALSFLLVYPAGALPSGQPSALGRAAHASSFTAADHQARGQIVHAGRSLVWRVLPAQRGSIVVQAVPPAGTRDVFELETRAGKLIIRGSSGVAIASGLRYYLEHYGNAHLSWGGSRLALTTPLPPVPRALRKRTSHAVRYAYNFTVHGYSTPYWSWGRWEREIDLLAMSGFNLALVTIGYEKVLIDTFTRFGYSAEALRRWIVMPAHQPWQWLDNMESAGPEVPARLVEKRAALGRRIVARMRELGITPVVPGYYGIVPPGFGAVTGAPSDVVDQGSWLGITERPDLLNPASPLFPAVADAHYRALARVFGPVTHFAADPFHEGGQTAGIDVQRAAANIHQAMRRAQQDAVWVLQAWLGNPSAELLAGIAGRRALVIDLWGDEYPGYLRFTTKGETTFSGVPWAWSIIQNFGGNTAVNGNLEVIASQYGPDGAFRDPLRGRLAGLGLTMEAIEQNPVVLDLLSELIWRPVRAGAIDLDAWIVDYADRRYGRRFAATHEAWQELTRTAYSTTPGIGTSQSILCARPSLVVENVSVGFGAGDPYYDTTLFERALAHLLSASGQLRRVDTYEYDVVNVTRQVLANRARPLLDEIRAAFERRDAARFDCLSRRFLDLIADQDRLVATRAEFLLGRWIHDARAWGDTPAEQDALERDARMILTTWLERDSLLHDYAHREWAGLLRDFYYVRWKRYFDYLAGQLRGEVAAPPDFFAIEAQWVDQTDPGGTTFPTVPIGDPTAVSEEVFARYAGPATSACLH
jgi:alpha-N-acetylglucosaminidase